MSEIRVDNITNEEGTGSPNIIYDNAASGLTATSIKGAIDEVSEQAVNSQELLAGVSEAADIDEAVSMIGKGAIVESDSNDNGFYIRWENGEQVCWVLYTGEISSGFEATVLSLPAEFSSNLVACSFSSRNRVIFGDDRGLGDTIVAASSTNWNLRVNGDTFTPHSGTVLFAWGFWK